MNRNGSKPAQLGFFSVALLYVGTVMGAGFASGREIWQFFGVFGKQGSIGIIFAAALFVALGMMTAYIARTLGSSDMGRVVVPGGNPKIISAIGYFMAGLLYTAIVSMTAAGGALLNQLFGLPRALGGILVTVLVILTVLGEFERVSKVFRCIMPVLFVTVVAVSLMVILCPLEPSSLHQDIEPSPLAPNWVIAALLYISVNMLGMIAVIAKSSVNAKNARHGIGGAGLGGVFLGLLSFVLLASMQKDMYYTQALDMPMLGFAGRLSPVLTVVYGLVTFCSIYSAATSNYYAFTTKIKEGPHKKKLVILFAFLGFLMGLMGFKNVIGILFPIIGFLGFLVIGMLIVNFFIVRNSKDRRNGFPGHDRHSYPHPLVKVTGGHGGDVLLILGPEKSALYDVGMCCFADKTIANIKRELDGTGRTVDYIFLSHSHYDHMGALPYILQEWPDAVVCASEKTKKVFESEGARSLIQKMGENAAEKYGVDRINIIVNNLHVDRVLKDGDEISLGTAENGCAASVQALETRGHTDCSMSYMILPEKILLCSESCGVLISPEVIEVSALKSFDETIETARRLKELDINHLYSQHYGMVPDWFRYEFFDLYIRLAGEQQEFIQSLIREGKSFEEILAEHEARYWEDSRDMEQPYEAYRINAESEIRQEITKLNKCNSEKL
ncbi:MAG: MBL fold metallo-hydrolase [Firmicutes bacterium]|nr:MBL fold metallo-hydrolase [Bacillota bacterium]